MKTMKILALLITAQYVFGFNPQRMVWLGKTQRPTSAIVLFDIDVDAVTNAVSIDQTKQTAPPIPPPPEEKPIEAAVALPTISDAPQVSASSPLTPSSSSASIPSAGDIDLPLPAIGVGLLAAFAGATFAMRGSVDEREEASSASPSATPTPQEGDISIPYDAAARLAYENSDKKMDYKAFQKKYEAEAIADVIAKRK